mmetsp:Transcript_13149/g.28424  ORF Transcript_13149/g.28424 Transcript_13149/m.28424 type:complete len:254 (+) Transcript_13149:1792-2553(+)
MSGRVSQAEQVGPRWRQPPPPAAPPLPQIHIRLPEARPAPRVLRHRRAAQPPMGLPPQRRVPHGRGEQLDTHGCLPRQVRGRQDPQAGVSGRGGCHQRDRGGAGGALPTGSSQRRPADRGRVHPPRRTVRGAGETGRGHAVAIARVRQQDQGQAQEVLDEEEDIVHGRAAVCAEPGRRAGVLPREGDTERHGAPSGPQAGQHRIHAGRDGQADRLRAGEDSRERLRLERGVQHERRDGLAAVHGPGSGRQPTV